MLRSRVAATLSEPRGIDYYAALLGPTWSAREVRARIVGLRHEASDTVSLLLEPNANWRGFRAGQHVSLTVTLDGVRHTRTFSISSSPRATSQIRITIRAFPGGLVSSWAVHRARRGDVVVLGVPQGELVVPEPRPSRILCISGGSGITPIMSIARDLLYSGYTGELTLLHYARNEIIFNDELTLLAEEFPNFHFVPRMTCATSHEGASAHLSRETLDSVHPEWRTSETFVCGPAPLERSVLALWDPEAARSRLHIERFSLRDAALPARKLEGEHDAEAGSEAMPGAKHRLVFAKSRIELQGNGNVSLLAQAEGAGLKPGYGCRMGICHTCTRTKHSGVVRDSRTGQLSGEGCESIQLCVSVPVSDVELDL